MQRQLEESRGGAPFRVSGVAGRSGCWKIDPSFSCRWDVGGALRFDDKLGRALRVCLDGWQLYQRRRNSGSITN
jgi:hypothetical protein